MSSKVELPEGQESFKLNEVCKLANVQPYMLRFWGTEFPQLEAGKSGTGQRLYTRSQVELILEVRRLLFDEGLTIAGARKRVNAIGAGPAGPKTSSARRKSKRKKAPAAAEPAEAPPAPPAAEVGEVDKGGPERVQPLVATLRQVRDEVAKLVDELKSEPAS